MLQVVKLLYSLHVNWNYIIVILLKLDESVKFV